MLDKSKTGRREKGKITITAAWLLGAFVLIGGIVLFGYILYTGPDKTNERHSETGLPKTDVNINQQSTNKTNGVSETNVQPGSEANDAPQSAKVTIPELDADAQALNLTKDYAQFTHGNQFHYRLPCLLCHRRDDNSAKIRFPGKSDHLPCAGCHSLQFSDQASPICTICHSNPQTGAMKSFPRLQSFGFRFDHSKHGNVNCATCHKSTGTGIARTIPSGPSAHLTCFQCHTSNSSNSMASCNVCHVPGRLVRTPEWTRAFRISFSHVKHLGNKEFNCSTCHSGPAGAARGRQMSAPLVSMHFSNQKELACSTCHDGKQAFGPDDFANCKRCHTGKSFKF